MRPVISGTFVISGDNGTTHLKLYVEFSQVAHQYELLTSKWSRLERDKTEPAEVINLKHIDVMRYLCFCFFVFFLYPDPQHPNLMRDAKISKWARLAIFNHSKRSSRNGSCTGKLSSVCS